MGADASRSRLDALREHSDTVRVRTTAGSVLVVGVALLIAAVSLVLLLRRSLTEDVRMATLLRANSVADQLERNPLSGPISGAGDEEFVQVLDPQGDVVASTANIAGASPLIRIDRGESRVIHVPFDDDPFLAVATSAETSQGTYTVVGGHTLDNVIESSAALVGLLAIGAPVLLLFVAAVTWWVVGKALAPVEAIRAEVESISSEALHRRVPVPGTKDEIAGLAATMNQMLGRLQDGRLRQTRFVSDASHELRSPIATMRQHAEVALAHPGSTSTQDLAGLVLTEDLRLEDLVEDLLLLARMDEGRSEGSRAVVDLDDIVFHEVERIRQVEGKAIDTTRVSGGRVLGFHKPLRRLVANLLDNADRHARTGVSISLFEQGDEVILQVDDDGSGIAPQDRQRIFERFVRLDDARDRDSGGAGLGLAIVYEVATDHGARALALRSSTGGARVEIRFPRLAD